MRWADGVLVNHGEAHHRTGVARPLFAVLTGLIVLYLAFLAGLPVGAADGFFERWLVSAIEVGAALACVCRVVLVREERRIWALVALSVSFWALGDAYWRIALWDLEVAPVPSLADVGWIAFYPPAYAAIVLLVRARVESVRATLWVDGVIGAGWRSLRSRPRSFSTRCWGPWAASPRSLRRALPTRSATWC